MALMLLHRFSDPIRHICIEGWQDKADNCRAAGIDLAGLTVRQTAQKRDVLIFARRGDLE